MNKQISLVVGICAGTLLACGGSGATGTTGAGGGTTATAGSTGSGATTGTTGASSTGAGGASGAGEVVSGPWATFNAMGQQTNTTNVLGKLVMTGTFKSPKGTCKIDSATGKDGTIGVNQGSGLGDQKLGIAFNTVHNVSNGVTFILKNPGAPTVGKVYGRDGMDGVNIYCNDANGNVNLATSMASAAWSKFEVTISAFDATKHTLTAKVDWTGTQATDTQFSVQGEVIVTGP